MNSRSQVAVACLLLVAVLFGAVESATEGFAHADHGEAPADQAPGDGEAVDGNDGHDDHDDHDDHCCQLGGHLFGALPALASAVAAVRQGSRARLLEMPLGARAPPPVPPPTA
jgi:hypothetical protein